jgi:hypothetical protein
MQKNLNTATETPLTPRQKFAQVTWTPADVQTLAPKMSEAEAEEWLYNNEGDIQDRLIEMGWEVISDLLAMSGIGTTDEEEEG